MGDPEVGGCRDIRGLREAGLSGLKNTSGIKEPSGLKDLIVA